MMLVTKRLACHLSVALVALLATTGHARSQDADTAGSASFAVFFRGSQVGIERVSVSRPPNGWQISATGNLGPPFDLVTTRFEMSYGADWQPQQLLIEGRLRGQGMKLTTSFGVTTATNDAVTNTERASNSQQITPRSVVLPNSFFAAYEALAMRLA